MKYAVLLDFGSTYTKVVCVDLQAQHVILSEKFPSTVQTDAGIALKQCFDAAERRIGPRELRDALKLSTSSAAGGLRIAVSGLTESWSTQAGRNASFGAGGKVVCKAAGLLTEEDIRRIQASSAEILLVCGGYEGGNREFVLRNIETISKSDLNIPIIYAGNSQVARAARMMLSSHGKECFAAENMIPDIGKLNIQPTVDIIRNLFMTRITNMKGIGMVKQCVDGPIIPTPAAVLAAGTLLYKGTDAKEGIGPFLMVDIGGATTDIYSFLQDTAFEGAKQIGAPEPESKRTVEGDMGMRESSICLFQEVGAAAFAQSCGLSEQDAEAAILKRISQKAYLADNPLEKRVDLEIACRAVNISAKRHAGIVTREICDGHKLVQRGKNLQGIQKVIGTGGILVNNDTQTAETILKQVNRQETERTMHLLPADAQPLVDRDYVFFAAGLLSTQDPDTALELMKKSIGIG